MAFPQQEPRAFTRAGIEWLTPKQYGCYGLYRQGVWIYVGKGDIRQRLLDHFNGDNPEILREMPTGWVATVTSDMDTEERRLILALQPICNKRVG